MFGLPGTLLHVARKEWPELSPDALRRLRMIDWHLANAANVSKTCRHFTISRQTLYRWLERYNPKDLRSLEDRSSRPRRCKQATWTKDEVLAVKAMRERFPASGKLKLAVLLSRQGLHLSVSRVGRILAYLKRTRQLIEPLRRFSAWRGDSGSVSTPHANREATKQSFQETSSSSTRWMSARNRTSCSSSSRPSMS